MKKPIITILAFVLLIAAMFGAVLYCFWDTATESVAENRTLASQPTANRTDWFSGSFSKAFESFLNDHVYARDVFISAAQTMEGSVEKQMELKIVKSTGALNAPSDTSGPVSQRTQEAVTNEPQTQDPGQTVDESAGDTESNVVILSDRILSTFHRSEKKLSYYADTVGAFFDLFPDYVIKVNMLVPSRIAFEESQVAALSDDQKATIEEVYAMLDPMVYTVDAYSALQAAGGDLDKIFFRTDHHWTHFGAYLGAKAIFDTLEQDFTGIEHYEEQSGDPFLGYLYDQHQTESLKQHRDALVCYFPREHETLLVENHRYDESGALTVSMEPILDLSRQGYYSFGSRSFSWMEIEGANPRGPSVLLVGDSYCNALSTWIGENASRLVVIDPRDYTGGKEGVLDLYQKYNFSQVIVCDYTGVLESSYFIGKIKSLTE